MNLNESESFLLNVLGEKTGERYTGQFNVLKWLTHRQELARDKVMRDLLGTNPQGASTRAKDQAEIFAELSVSIVKSPDWFSGANQGLDLADDTPIAEIYANVVKIRAKAIEELQDKAKAADESLKKTAQESK